MSWVGDVQTGTGTPKTTVQFLQTRQPEADLCSEIVRRQAMDVALHWLCMLLEAPRYSWRPIRGVHGFPKPYAHLHGGVGPPMGAVTCHRHGERQSSPPHPISTAAAAPPLAMGDREGGRLRNHPQSGDGSATTLLETEAQARWMIGTECPDPPTAIHRCARRTCKRTRTQGSIFGEGRRERRGARRNW